MEQEKGLPRMRTASGVLDEIKREDPQSSVTMHCVKSIVASGAVPIVLVGRKQLVDVDAVLAYLRGGGSVRGYSSNTEGAYK